jgi:hypothetical protein
MRYSATTFLTAAVVAAAFSRSGLTQSVDQSHSAGQTASSPRAAFQDREIASEQALQFILGDRVGIAYFTSEAGGFRLVATIAAAEGTEATPIRFVTTLAQDQMATMSVPRKAGEKSIEVTFLRRGERLIVKTPSSAGNSPCCYPSVDPTTSRP